MKSVLISIQPKWCELIASGEKTVEVRKTKPKLETPFKVYIYMTKEFSRGINSSFYYYKSGKVIGEFVCDVIHPVCYTLDGLADVVDCKMSCLKPKDFVEYGKGKPLYGWHISDLVIYDKPKELSEFYNYDPAYNNAFGWAFSEEEKRVYLKRPPQSWCYVERNEG